MTDQELIKALRRCNGSNGCTGCPRQHYGQPMLQCTSNVLNEAIDRLEALVAENEALNERDKAHKELEQALERKCAALKVRHERLKAGKDTNVPTNADKIRAMTDGELAKCMAMTIAFFISVLYDDKYVLSEKVVCKFTDILLRPLQSPAKCEVE